MQAQRVLRSGVHPDASIPGGGERVRRWPAAGRVYELWLVRAGGGVSWGGLYAEVGRLAGARTHR